MALTKTIPQKLKESMAADPYYQRCCVTDIPAHLEKIDWHHNFESYLHGNRGRVNEAWCILPLVWWIHAKADLAEVREYLNWIMLTRATDETLKHWSVTDELLSERSRLNQIYGTNKKDLSFLHPNQGRGISTIDF